MATDVGRRNRANPRQRAQRAETRERLIEGAVRVFADKGYVASAVEDVLKEAGVSRASFYAHFAGKADLAAALADGFVPIWQPLYVELACMRTFALSDIEHWCRRNLELYRANEAVCIILTQAAAIEADIYWKIAGYQEALVDLLADRNDLLPHLRNDVPARHRAALALSQLDQACYFLAIRQWKQDPDAGISAMAAQLHHFLTTEATRGGAA